MNFQERNQLIDALIEGEISEVDFLRLEAELSVDPAARKEYYARLALSTLLEAEAGAQSPATRKILSLPAPARRWVPAFAAMAAAIAVSLGLAGLFFKSRPDGQRTVAQTEQRASGFAVLAGQANTVWKNSAPLAEGALVPAGRLHLASSVAQIELFSSVTLVVEGEAEFEILSPMEMSVTRGKVRARVPEPAHGFRIRTAEGDIVDLGTEFALNVSSSHSEVHVLDGEVESHPRSDTMRRMEKGEALRWSADGQGAKLAANASGFVGMAELSEKLVFTRKTRRDDWQRFSATLRRDPRLLA